MAYSWFNPSARGGRGRFYLLLLLARHIFRHGHSTSAFPDRPRRRLFVASVQFLSHVRRSTCGVFAVFYIQIPHPFISLIPVGRPAHSSPRLRNPYSPAGGLRPGWLKSAPGADDFVDSSEPPDVDPLWGGPRRLTLDEFALWLNLRDRLLVAPRDASQHRRHHFIPEHSSPLALGELRCCNRAK